MTNIKEYLRGAIEYEGKIRGIALAIDLARHSDEAASVAWRDRMEARRSTWRRLFRELDEAGQLRDHWSPKRASEALWSMTSPASYRELTDDCNWTPEEYEQWVIDALERLFIAN